MAILIKEDGTETKVKPANGKTFSLRELQLFVGGYIEQIIIPDGRKMIVNEEGKIKGYNLNTKASTLSTNFDIFGDVIIVDDNEVN